MVNIEKVFSAVAELLSRLPCSLQYAKVALWFAKLKWSAQHCEVQMAQNNGIVEQVYNYILLSSGVLSGDSPSISAWKLSGHMIS